MASNTYGAIKLSTAEDVGAVLKKKTGSADGYKPKEWADTINLLGLLPIRTASGTIAHFEDGADDVPMKSVVANIVPIQDLHGYDSPWVGGAGRNLFNMGSKVSATHAGMTITSDDDYLIVNGTKYGNAYFVPSTLGFTLPSGTYHAKAFTSGTASSQPSIYVMSGSDVLTTDIRMSEFTFTLSEETTLTIRFAFWTDNATYNNYKIGIVISKTSGIDKFYPYENICPISGWSGANVTRTGANVWDEEWELGAYDDTTGEPTSANAIRCKNYIQVFSGQTYRFVISGIDVYAKCVYYDNNKNVVSVTTNAFHNQTAFTIPNGVSYMRFSMAGVYGTTYLNNISINYPSTDTSYHAYTGSTYTFDLGQEIMGGTADCVGGTGSKTKAYYDFTNKNTPWDSGAPNEAGFIRFVRNIADKATGYYLLCDKFPTKSGIVPSSPTEEAISGYTSNNSIYIAVSTSRLSGDLTTSAGRRQAFNDWIDANGLEICYELATPAEYTFTGQPINSLLGVNNVWTDSGEVLDVEYRADMNLLIAELGG